MGQNITKMAAVVVFLAMLTPFASADWVSDFYNNAAIIYTFELNTSTQVLDSTANSYDASFGNGQLNYADVRINASGLFGNGMFFSGANQFSNMTIPIGVWNDERKNYTYMVWYNPDGLDADNHGLINKGESGSAGDFMVRWAGAGISDCGVYTDDGWFETSGGTFNPPIGSWSHLACVYDGATLKSYFNGNLVVSVVATGVVRKTDAFPINFGLSHSTAGHFRGLVDDFRFYNYSFTGDQINITYNSSMNGDTAPYIPPTNRINITAYNKGNGTVFTQFSLSATNGVTDYFNLTMTPGIFDYTDLPSGVNTITFNTTGFKNYTITINLDSSTNTSVDGYLPRFQEFYGTNAAYGPFTMILRNSTSIYYYNSSAFIGDSVRNITTIDNMPWGIVTGNATMTGFDVLPINFRVNGSSEYNTSLNFGGYVNHQIFTFDEQTADPIYFSYSITNSSNVIEGSGVSYNQPWYDVFGDVVISVSNTSYVTRNFDEYWSPSGSFNKSYYLLKSGNGYLITFYVKSVYDSIISGALCQASKLVGSSWVMVERSHTGSSGSCALYLNPLSTYQLYFEASGYNPASFTLQPSDTSPQVVHLTGPVSTNFTTLFSNIMYSFQPASNSLNKSANQTITCFIFAPNQNLVYAGLNITANRTISLFVNRSTSPFGTNYSVDIDGTKYVNITANCYFKKYRFGTWSPYTDSYNITRTFRIYNMTAEPYGLPSIMKKLDTIGRLLVGLICLGIVAAVMAAFSRITGGFLAAVIGLIILGLFTFYLTWFDWKVYMLLCLVILAYQLIKREI